MNRPPSTVDTLTVKLASSSDYMNWLAGASPAANPYARRFLLSTILALFAACAIAKPLFAQHARSSFAEVNRHVQERSVKIYGAGGLRQLEAYQSGMIVSAEGHVATVLSLVLDEDEATVVLGDGRRYTGKVLGVDQVAEIALLKLDAEDETFPHLDLSHTAEVFEGMRLLAFSNLYNVATGDEPVSVLHGSLAAIAPLEARRGAFSTRYRGEVYIVDAATNNPGAAGGALVDLAGQPLGMLGKEVRSEVTGAWLNYALPLPQVAKSVEKILAGGASDATPEPQELPEHPATFAALGFQLVPDVVSRTPPYVDRVAADSPAAAAGIRPDDLVLAVGRQITGSRREMELALSRISIDESVALTILRNNQLIEVELTATDEETER